MSVVKGQVFSFDFLLASSIFLLTVGILFTYWVYINIQIEETRVINDMVERAYKSSDVWFREGIPTHWNSANVIELGLENDHKLNQTKMNITKIEIGYERTRTMIGLGEYEYNITIYNTTNDTVFSLGLNPSDPLNLLKIKRIGIYDGSIVTLEVMVWNE